MSAKHDKKPIISPRSLLNTAIAVIFLVIYALVATFSTLDPLIVGGVLAVCLILAEFLGGKLYGFFSFRMSPDDETLSPILSNVTLDFILKLYLPVVICDENGRIIWYNNATEELHSEKNKSTASKLPHTIASSASRATRSPRRARTTSSRSGTSAPSRSASQSASPMRRRS